MRLLLILFSIFLGCHSLRMSEREKVDYENCQTYVGKTFFFEKSIEEFNQAAAAPDFSSLTSSSLIKYKGLSRDTEKFVSYETNFVPILKVEYQTYSPKLEALSQPLKTIIQCSEFREKKVRIKDNLDIKKVPFTYFSLNLNISYRGVNLQFDLASIKNGIRDGFEIIGEIKNTSSSIDFPQEAITMIFPQGSAVLIPPTEGASFIIPAKTEESLKFEIAINNGGNHLKEYVEMLLKQTSAQNNSNGTKSIVEKVQKNLKIEIGQTRIEPRNVKFSISAKNIQRLQAL